MQNRERKGNPEARQENGFHDFKISTEFPELFQRRKNPQGMRGKLTGCLQMANIWEANNKGFRGHQDLLHE